MLYQRDMFSGVGFGVCQGFLVSGCSRITPKNDIGASR